MTRAAKAPLPARILRRLEPLLGLRLYVVTRQALTFGMGDIPIPESLVVREAQDDDLERAVRRPELDISREHVRSARSRGDRCFAAFEGTAMVAYTWRSTSWAPHENVGVSISPPYVYGYKGVTLPTHRGLHLNAIVNRAANEAYRSDGFTHYVGFASPYNQASLNAMKAEFGYERIGYVAYGTVFGRFWSRYTPGVKATSFRFGAPPG